MKIEVLLFAQLADALDCSSLDVELPEGATAAAALDALAGEHDSIAAMRRSLALAVNDAYAAPDTPLSDGDRLALIPPVSGG